MVSSKINRPSLRALFVIYFELIFLLILTAVGAYLPIGMVSHDILAFGISIAKAGLIVLFFMEAYYESGLVRFLASAGVIWLLLLFLLTFSDYLTRD